MPSRTFLNLPKEKQDILLTSAIKEFSRTNFNDASINKIITTAGISRGSFYMYFNDKEDLYGYIFKNYIEKVKLKIIEYLKNNNGDFIKSCEELHQFIITYCEEEKHHNLFKNFFNDIKFSSENKIFLKPDIKRFEEEKDQFLSLINSDLYQYKTEAELFDAFMFTIFVTISSIIHHFHNDLPINEIDTYQNRLHIIKYGIYRKEETNDTNL